MRYLLVGVGDDGSVDDRIDIVTPAEDEVQLGGYLLQSSALLRLLLLPLFLHQSL